MSQIIHDISSPNDGLGDALRVAFDNQNDMNAELYDTKVDKVAGKTLSDNNFSDADKAKLDSLENGLQLQSDWLQEDDTEPDFIKNKPDYLNAIGSFHYSDLATQTTPISVTSGVETLLTNDGNGVYTNTTNAPYGVPKVWNDVTNSFDFSSLEVGDLVHIRPDLDIDLTGTNTSYEVYMKFAIGTASEWILSFSNAERKSTDAFKKNSYIGFDISNSDTKTAPAKVYIKTDASATVKVNGWYIEVLRKNINIIDIVPEKYTDNDFSTVAVGGIPTNYSLQGKGLTEIFKKMLVVFLDPIFTAFSMAQSQLIEVGVALSGNKTFNWTATNPTNIVANSLIVTDVTTNTVIGTGLANDGTEVLDIGTITNTSPITRNWNIKGTDLESKIFTSANFTVNSIYPIFYGVANTQPTANQALIDSGTKAVVQSTGTLNVTFGASGQFLWFAHPASNTTKTKWYVNALNNGNIGTISDLFNAPTTVSITTVLWAGVSYKIYISNFTTTTVGNMELKNS